MRTFVTSLLMASRPSIDTLAETLATVAMLAAVLATLATVAIAG